MATIMLGTCQELVNQTFTRLAAAADAKAAAGTPVQHVPPLPGYTATLGLAYGSDQNQNRNWDIFDAAIASGTAPGSLRFTAEDAINVNYRRVIATLAGCSPAIIIPVVT